MNKSHNKTSKPSTLLVLVCLAVVHRLRPEWISITIDGAARGKDVSPQRLSRLCSRAVAPFQVALDALTRIGRPTRNMLDNCAMEENALLRSLLGVATAIPAHVSLRRPAIRALVVGAFLRLKQEHPELTKKRFCETFTVSSRTFRHWMAHRGKTNSGSPIAPPPEKKRPPKRPPRRPRFGFQVILPDTQVAADTTDLRACQIPLKLVAAQDIGGRDQDLFDSIIVNDHESADPAAWLADALDKQLIPDTGRLLFGGVGLGRRWLIDSIDLLIQMNGHIAASDIANGVFAKFAATDSIAIDKQGLNSVRVLFENVLNDKIKTQTDCAKTLATAILRNNGP